MGKLFVVGTPIGNLEDFSPRAIKTLNEVDFIAAEDTRVTIKLLNRFDIKKPMVSYYEHNLQERGQYIVGRIIKGESCAIVSDAGMPCISDPGEDLVRLSASQGIEVVVIPGPSAVISALAVSGLITSRFTFEGFLSTAKKSRMEHLTELANERRTMIFYEAPHKLVTTLKDMLKFFGDRQITLARELTKIHEEVIRTTLEQAVANYENLTPKGEFVLILSGCEKKSDEEKLSLEQVAEIALKMVEKGEKATDVAKELAKEHGYSKAQIYQKILQ